MSSNAFKTFQFAILMCVVCSFALTGAAVGLKSFQEKNMMIDRQKNILKALNLYDNSIKMTGEDVEKTYASKVKEFFVDEKGSLTKSVTSLPIFIVGSLDNVEKYAVPFKAYGLWSWIYGYVALDSDAETIIGMTVYDHKETPGLGGEVEKAWFQNQYIGKKVTDINGEFVSVGVVKGKVKDANLKEESIVNYVDGISGATITSKGVERDMKADLQLYELFSKSLRRG